MSIEVHGGYRPGKPSLAIVVSAALLAGMLLAASWFTHARNRPITLGQPQALAGLAGGQIAWPAGYEPVQVPDGEGPIVGGVEAPEGEGLASQVLFALVDTLGDTYLPPEFAVAVLLNGAQQQLDLRQVSREQTLERTMLAGLPAIQLGRLVHRGSQVYWMELRATCTPMGVCVGLMRLTQGPPSPAGSRVMEQVAGSVEVPSEAQAPKDALAALGLETDLDMPATLKGFVHEMPHLGPTRVTLASLDPDATDASKDYALDVWLTWLAEGRELPALALSYMRRAYSSAAAKAPAEWVGDPRAGVYRIMLLGPALGSESLSRWLYLKALPDRRVLWVMTTVVPGGPEADLNQLVTQLLHSAQPTAETAWAPEQAVAAGRQVLDAIRGEPIVRYYQANVGRRRLVFANSLGRAIGNGQRTVAIERGEALTRGERVSIRQGDAEVLYRSQGEIVPDLGTFAFSDQIQRNRDSGLLVAYRRNGQDQPIKAIVQAGQTPETAETLTAEEPFLPEPAQEAAAFQLAQTPGVVALFRTVGPSLESLESVQLIGLGEQEIAVLGRRIRAFVCASRADSADAPSLLLFDEDGRMLGLYLSGGATLLAAE